jgi:broad specificity phosphatase PhoE
MARLLLLRHGQSVWNAEARWQGQADPPLTPLGEAQAAVAVEWLRGFGFTAVVTSDLERSRRTAEIIAGALGLPTPTVEPGLRERDVGEWSGHTVDEITTRWPGQLEAWREGLLERTPGGEHEADFSARIMEAVRRLAGADGVLLVVTHGGVIHGVGRALEARWRGSTNLTGWWVEDGLVAGERSGPPEEETNPAAVTTVL